MDRYEEAEVQRAYVGGGEPMAASLMGRNAKAESLDAHFRRRALTSVLRAGDQGITLDQLQAAIDLVRAHVGE